MFPMVTLRLCLLSLLVSGLLFTYINPASATTEPALHHKKFALVVRNLEEIVGANPNLAKAIKGMLIQAPKNSIWHYKTVHDVYVYLNHLLKTPIIPGVPEESFFSLRYSKMGLRFYDNPMIRSWFESFFHQIYINMSLPSSRPLIKQWEQTLGVKLHMQDFIIPKGGFKSFLAFFDRHLKPGMRPISNQFDNSVIVSPNDGKSKLFMAQVNNKQAIQVKGDKLNIRDIFNNNLLAEKFIGGPVIKQFLSETNYHHFHAPVSGQVVYADIFSGLRTAEHHWERTTFNHNRAVYIIYNPCVGYVGMVPVGFWDVGSIDLFKKKGDLITKGEEIGQFKLGSSILLFFEPDRIITNETKAKYIPIKVGQQLGHTRLACKK